MTDELHQTYDWTRAIRESDLPPLARLVAHTLADYMSAATGQAFPSNARLQRDTGLSERAVRKHLGVLVESGWLDVVERGGIRGGRRQATRYVRRFPGAALERLIESATGRAAEPKGAPGAGVGEPKGARGAGVKGAPGAGVKGRRGHEVPLKGAPGAPQLSRELTKDLVSTSDEVLTRQQSKTGKTPRKPDPLFDALVDACRIDPAELTRPARGALNAALRDLRAVDATPDEIHQRAEAYRRMWPTVTLTPTALARHWAECVPRAGPVDLRAAEIARVQAWAQSLDREVS